MAADELYRVMAFVRNVHGVEKKPLTLLWIRAPRVILRLDTYPDVSCSGFGRGHLLYRLMIAHVTVSVRPNFVFKAVGFSRSSLCLPHSDRPSTTPPKEYLHTPPGPSPDKRGGLN